MTTSTAENQETAQATAMAEKPEANKKAHTSARKAGVAPTKARSRKKATPAMKGAKAAKHAKLPKTATGARQGSKTERVLELLKRSGGASLKDIMKATDWQAHSVRGFLSGTLARRWGSSSNRPNGRMASAFTASRSRIARHLPFARPALAAAGFFIWRPRP